MRRIRYYVFKAGTKLPFAELPALIHQFLDEQGLKSASFFFTISKHWSSREASIRA